MTPYLLQAPTLISLAQSRLLLVAAGTTTTARMKIPITTSIAVPLGGLKNELNSVSPKIDSARRVKSKEQGRDATFILWWGCAGQNPTQKTHLPRV